MQVMGNLASSNCAGACRVVVDGVVKREEGQAKLVSRRRSLKKPG